MSRGHWSLEKAGHARRGAQPCAPPTVVASPGSAAKSPLEQSGRFGGAGFFARHAVDDEDEAAAVAHGRGHDAVAAGGGLAGLDAVGAGEAAEQRVAVGVRLPAETELALGEQAVALREL